MDVLHQLVLRQERKAKPRQRCVNLRRRGVEDQRTIHAHVHLAAAFFEVPHIQSARRWHALVNALVRGQVAWRPGDGMALEILR
jgi:hypothetical protein